MWKNGALQGNREEEAFMLMCDERNNSIEDENSGHLNIDIAVSISKPLEYIVIHLNRVQNDHDHANINLS
jgi:phage tail sheath protein FI